MQIVNISNWKSLRQISSATLFCCCENTTFGLFIHGSGQGCWAKFEESL